MVYQLPVWRPVSHRHAMPAEMVMACTYQLWSIHTGPYKYWTDGMIFRTIAYSHVLFYFHKCEAPVYVFRGWEESGGPLTHFGVVDPFMEAGFSRCFLHVPSQVLQQVRSEQVWFGLPVVSVISRDFLRVLRSNQFKSEGGCFCCPYYWSGWTGRLW